MPEPRLSPSTDPAHSRAGGPAGLDGVTAVVLTHLRPRHAGDVTRALLRVEGFAPEQVMVVVNQAGGLDDPALEAKVRLRRLPTNTGPAGGFRAGLLEAFADTSTAWAYLCEDDVGLFRLPAPRVASLLARVAARPPGDRPVGAVVAYGRRFAGRGGHTVNTVPPPGSPQDLDRVDVACWGATLVSRAVVEAGVLPDPEWFFGYEDFDFFSRVRAAGFSVLVDSVAARAVADQQTLAGRDLAHRESRPTDAEEAWRAYYVARNYFALARRHGTPAWIAWHLAYSLRRLQLAHSRAERLAIVHGVWDGARGRLGQHPRYRRVEGERPAPV
jgi:hypothetical protein